MNLFTAARTQLVVQLRGEFNGTALVGCMFLISA